MSGFHLLSVPDLHKLTSRRAKLYSNQKKKVKKKTEEEGEKRHHHIRSIGTRQQHSLDVSLIQCVPSLVLTHCYCHNFTENSISLSIDIFMFVNKVFLIKCFCFASFNRTFCLGGFLS